jgi:hypothetical protein
MTPERRAGEKGMTRHQTLASVSLALAAITVAALWAQESPPP